ncbi:MAG: SMC-Scp complex subunit ScpB [Candidatus Ryanbacteria bacterium]|nr:SMC-Scp complex subunit ScpB [Candidatus Ryanbacteria bacterium]
MDELNNNNLPQSLEALLFVSGEPLALKDLARLSGADKREVAKALNTLKDQLTLHGIRLLQSEDTYTLVTAPETSEVSARIAKERLEGDLTRSQLEALAIILWKGRVSRSSIDYVRGVNSAFALRALLIRGLIERSQDEHDARVFLYRPTLDLFKYLGITSSAELPSYDDIAKDLKDHG